MVWRFSKTASANGNADGTINYAEGQAPSSINDSARAEMARVAQWRDDISGTITTGGTSTAYTVTSNQVFDTLAHMDGAMIAFVPHTTSGLAPTLNVDGLGAKKIRFQTGIDIPDGSLVQGTPYVVTYGSATEFILHGFAGNPYSVPLGGVIMYTAGATPNSAFAFPFGQAISRTTYSAYYGLVGLNYGSGDGSTTFNIPDIRGRSVFGLDNMGGSTAGRITAASGITGTTLGAFGGEETHTLTTNELAAHAHANSLADPGHDHAQNPNTLYGTAGSTIGTGSNNVTQGSGPRTGSSFTGISITNANAGGGLAHNNMPPAIILPFILRII